MISSDVDYINEYRRNVGLSPIPTDTQLNKDRLVYKDSQENPTCVAGVSQGSKDITRYLDTTDLQRLETDRELLDFEAYEGDGEVDDYYNGESQGPYGITLRRFRKNLGAIHVKLPEDPRDFCPKVVNVYGADGNLLKVITFNAN